jgi:hypothetical protein
MSRCTSRGQSFKTSSESRSHKMEALTEETLSFRDILLTFPLGLSPRACMALLCVARQRLPVSLARRDCD